MKFIFVFCGLMSLQSLFAQIPDYLPTDSLIAWYPFNSNAIDESFNGNNGTLFGGVTLNDDRFSNASSAHNFDGVPLTYINCGNDPSFDITSGGSITLSAWIKSETGGMGSQGIVSKASSTTTNIYGSYGLNIVDGVPRFIVSNEGGLPVWYESATSPDTLELDVWTHIVGIADSSNLELRLYVDGDLVSTNPWGGTLHSGVQDFIIGCRYKSDFASQYMYNFLGDIDDVAIWNRVLDQCEIVDLYTAGLLGDASQTGTLLTATQSGANYQWLDCDDSYSIITGETNQSYTPTLSGNYAVEVTINGCVDTSACFIVDYTSIEENDENDISIYPNPTNDRLIIVNTVGVKSVEIIAVTGERIKELVGSFNALDVSDLSNGIYYLRVNYQSESETFRFVKK